ncbi:MAG: hypothetical protein AB7L13_05540 [Acidimicrobiia bacterium]
MRQWMRNFSVVSMSTVVATALSLTGGVATAAAVAATPAEVAGPAEPGPATTADIDASVVTIAPLTVVAMVDDSTTFGEFSYPSYRLVGRDGRIISFTSFSHGGVTQAVGLRSPVVGYARSGNGDWLVTADGGVTTIDGQFYGSASGLRVNAPIVGMQALPGILGGYWLYGGDGGVYAYGAAQFYGSASGISRAPIVGMARTASGLGYWLVASDGGVFSYGDAQFHGSLGGRAMNRPIVAITATPDGQGYWLTADDGGVFAFGNAAYHGSLSNVALASPIIGLAASRFGGYYLYSADGGVFAFGAAPYLGSLVQPDTSTIVLSATGVGIAEFGDDELSALTKLVRVLGPPDVSPSYCYSADEVRWRNGFAVTITDHKFTGWHFSAFLTSSSAPALPLKTAEGATVGFTFDEIVALYGPTSVTATNAYGGFDVETPSGVISMIANDAIPPFVTSMKAGADPTSSPCAVA